MGSHPANLALRFLLELTALIIAGVWGWHRGEGWTGWFLALTVPAALAAAWGIFAVPQDPSRSGAAPVAVPGIVRLLLELAIFSLATWAFFDLGYTRAGWMVGILAVLHYAVSFDRIQWLMKQ